MMASKAFTELMQDANFKVEENKTAIMTLSDIKMDVDTVWLVGAPIDNVPEEALFTGSFFYSESDMELLNYLLTNSGKRVIRTDSKAIGTIFEGSGAETTLSLMKKGYFVFSSLPPQRATEFFRFFNERGIRHENMGSKDNRVLDDLFFQEQILKRIGARTVNTAWITVADYFKFGDNKNEFLRLIGDRIEKVKIRMDEKVFIRLGKGSLKYARTEDVIQNPFIRALANLPAFLASSTIGKLRKTTANFLSSGKVEHNPETIATGDVAKRELETIAKLSKENEKTITAMNSIMNDMVSDTHKTTKEGGLEDWIINADPEIIAKKIADSFMLAFSSGMLTDAVFAIREYIDVKKGSNGKGYTVPFSRDYMTIVYGDKVIAVTTWTPYRDVLSELKNGTLKLSDYEISDKAYSEVKRVSEAFSKETGYSSFTLDFMIPEDGMPYFHEMNRLEFSGMSHPMVRALLSYRRYCSIVEKPVEKADFERFISGMIDDEEKFIKLFYGRMFAFLGHISERDPKFVELVELHKKISKEEFEAFRYYSPIRLETVL